MISRATLKNLFEQRAVSRPARCRPKRATCVAPVETLPCRSPYRPPASGDSLSTPLGQHGPRAQHRLPGATSPRQTRLKSRWPNARASANSWDPDRGRRWQAGRPPILHLRAARTHFELDELMPAVFLGFSAVMLLKAAGTRVARGAPLGKLPPSSYRAQPALGPPGIGATISPPSQRPSRITE